MKTGLNIWIYFLILAGLSACDTKQDWFDSGISSPYHDCSIMEYLQKDTANWKLTVELIERAELTHIFEGKDPNYKEITFFAPPSLSILRYVWDKASGKEQFPGDPDRWRALSEDEKNHPEHLVQALDKDWCREMVLRHVIKGKHLKDEIAFRNRDYEIEAEEQTGGTDFTCESGNKLRAYREKTNYGGVTDAGSVIIHQGNILPFIMYQLSRILLHVDFMNSYFLPPGRRFDFHAAVLADGEVELGNLIVLRIVGVKIVLPVKSAEPGNGTAGSKANSHGIFHHLLIQYGKGARHSGTDGTGMGIGRSAESSGAAAEDFGPGCQFYMNLKADYCFVLLCHLSAPPFIRIRSAGFAASSCWFWHCWFWYCRLFCPARTVRETASGLLIGKGRLNQFFLLEAVTNQLQADGKPPAVQAAGQADSGKSRQIGGNRIDISQIHPYRIRQALSQPRRCCGSHRPQQAVITGKGFVKGFFYQRFDTEGFQIISIIIAGA